jgi:hypothetical protein
MFSVRSSSVSELSQHATKLEALLSQVAGIPAEQLTKLGVTMVRHSPATKIVLVSASIFTEHGVQWCVRRIWLVWAWACIRHKV